ncbi:MAG: TfoX domain-containing protein [candidate division TM6 bacterium GW2011_GWF2_37_49]|nr:MAG: TfoX domain-containing protein [candidate division TM6 bacterium GW2011_GWF2_37_49]
MHTFGYVDYIVDMLSPLKNIRVKRMFSGYGLYSGSKFFALILSDVLYFKVVEHERSIYQLHGSQPFTYTKKTGQRIALSYWQVPADIIENQTKLIAWAERALKTAEPSH